MYKGDRTPPAAENVPEGTETGVFDGERAREFLDLVGVMGIFGGDRERERGVCVRTRG